MIFISYRREDSVGHAGRIFDRLAEQLGRDQVCRDIDSLPPGEDFVLAIEHIVKQSDVLLALIGPRWITATDDEGHWRLANEDDPVRLEIVTALQNNVRVVPVLLQGARMPKAKDLPGDLASLAHKNAIEIRDTSFDQDVSHLLHILAPAWRHKLLRIVKRRPRLCSGVRVGCDSNWHLGVSLSGRHTRKAAHTDCANGARIRR